MSTSPKPHSTGHAGAGTPLRRYTLLFRCFKRPNGLPVTQSKIQDLWVTSKAISVLTSPPPPCPPVPAPWLPTALEHPRPAHLRRACHGLRTRHREQVRLTLPGSGFVSGGECSSLSRCFQKEKKSHLSKLHLQHHALVSPSWAFYLLLMDTCCNTVICCSLPPATAQAFVCDRLSQIGSPHMICSLMYVPCTKKTA